jgi:hypothetical protein
MNINEYRAQFAAYNSALELARYRRHVGSEPEYGIDQVRADHADLFSASALADLQSHLDQLQAETESAGVRRLLQAAQLEYVENQVDEASRELSHCESSMRLRWYGETVSAEAVSFHLATEPHKIRRDELARVWTNELSTCDDLRMTRVRLLHNAASRLGFDSYGDLIAQATGTNLSQMQLDTEGLLKQTEETHRVALSTLVKRELSAVSASALNFADLAYLERASWLDKFFLEQNWPTIYRDMMNGLGIRVDKQPNIQTARAQDSRSAQSAECFPVNPPGDVRLVCSPGLGTNDLSASLHAAGLAQQHAWCSKNLAEVHPEFVYSSDSATNDGYGYLFRLLLLEPGWIKELFQPISEAQARMLVRDLASLLVLRVRRLAAETSYAILLHSEAQPSPEQLQIAFVDLHERATGFRFRPEFFLLNLPQRNNAASRLRSLSFAAGLREYLRVRYGNRWWASRKAGDELIDLWNTASRYSVEELARLIGFGDLSCDLIVELLNETGHGA